MRFSIIVPIYNVEEYLPRCVESVLRQSFEDFELILVDDGSPDGCPKMCDNYGSLDSRIKVVHKQNGGLVSARKAGVAEAHGDYAMALDGDDWIAPDMLAKMNNVIKMHNTDVVLSGYFEAQESGIIKPHKKSLYREGYYNRKDIEELILPSLLYGFNGARFPHHVWGMAFRLELYKLEQLLVPDTIKIGEDAAVTCPVIFRSNSLYILDECLYFYRRNMSSMTKNRRPFSYEDSRLKAIHLEKRFDLDNFNLRDQVYRATVHSLFNACITHFWDRKPYSIVKKEIERVLDDDYYHNAIDKVRFNAPIDRKIMAFVMKKRLIFYMWLYSRFKVF